MAILEADMPGTVHFLLNECTADEYSWISEISSDITQQTRSVEFVQALHQLSKKYPEETSKFNIGFFIEEAEALLKE